MCQHCQICRSRDTPSAGGHVATGIIQDPPFPFHTISIDHKAVTAPRATGYQYTLVVVDMLTWFVTAIPTKTMSAKETLTALMEQVFTKYSFPLVIKSDNGTAFRNELMACFQSTRDFGTLTSYPKTLRQMGWRSRALVVLRVCWSGRLSSSRIGHQRYQWLRSH
eukprot:6204628-Pleurochrysis_carterae.AAC.1